MKVTKIRAGLYAVGPYRIEERSTMIGWAWRVTDTDNFSDPWVGDFATKREALQEISAQRI